MANSSAALPAIATTPRRPRIISGTVLAYLDVGRLVIDVSVCAKTVEDSYVGLCGRDRRGLG